MTLSRKNKKRPAEKTEVWENAPWLEGAVEEIKAARKSGDTEDPIDVMLYDPFAIRLTRGFIKSGWPANAVTLMSLFVGIGGSILFYPQNRWINLIGIFVVLFAAVLDCCDGQIARLTHTSSQLGRVLDGTVDITNFLSIYIVLGLRMMRENIPFIESPWAYYIWVVIIVTMYCHASQARLADYYRGLHLFFLEGVNRSYLSRVKNLKKELKSLPKGTPWYEKVYRRIYLVYTKAQEWVTPQAQRLLDAVEENKGASEEASNAYVVKSRRYIQVANLLTYNLRIFTLFILLLLGFHAFYFPFVVIIMEVIKYFMLAKYEKIARDVYRQFFSGHGDNSQAATASDRKD